MIYSIILRQPLQIVDKVAIAKSDLLLFFCLKQARKELPNQRFP